MPKKKALTLRPPNSGLVPLVGPVCLLVARSPRLRRPHHVQEPLGGRAEIVEAGDHRPDGDLGDHDEDEQDPDAMHPLRVLDARLGAGEAVARGGLLPHPEGHAEDEAEREGDNPPKDDHEVVPGQQKKRKM